MFEDNNRSYLFTVWRNLICVTHGQVALIYDSFESWQDERSWDRFAAAPAIANGQMCNILLESAF